MAGNLFILRFLVLPHLHKERGSWMLRALWKEGENGAAAISILFLFLREIYLEHLIVLIKISIFGASVSILVSHGERQRYIGISIFCPNPIKDIC